MSSNPRPGGLTALAVFNFIFGCLSVIGAFGSLVLPRTLEMVANQPGISETQRQQMQALADIGPTTLYLLAGGSLISAILLIASGVGYLKLKKFLGRTLGNASALFGLAAALASALWLAPQLGGGFNIASIINFIYPFVTLILLNTTFKEDFVN